MPESRSDSHNVLVVLLIAWVGFAVVYPLSWQPWSIMVRPKTGTRTIPLKLSETGPLRLMLDQGSVVTLAVPKGGAPTDGKTPLQIADPTMVMPADVEKIEGAVVQSMTCLGGDRQSDCYAVVTVGNTDADTVMKASRVWVMLERQ